MQQSVIFLSVFCPSWVWGRHRCGERRFGPSAALRTGFAHRPGERGKV